MKVWGEVMEWVGEKGGREGGERFYGGADYMVGFLAPPTTTFTAR